MAQNSFLQKLLNPTGISQADLAGFLHISRSVVNMVCRKERMLPTAAHLQLINIAHAMENLQPVPGSSFTSYAPLIQPFTQRA